MGSASPIPTRPGTPTPPRPLGPGERPSPLRTLRASRGLRLADVVGASGQSERTVRRLDRGQYLDVTLRQLAAVAMALGVAPADLVPGFVRRPRPAPAD